jgi:glycosyltransferase involved in cell wall biosynthesis
VNPRTSIVLPCRNQADHLGRILADYLRVLDGTSFELIVVPNASRDRTRDIADEVAGRDSRVRVIANPASGWGASVRLGLDAARGSVLAYTNSARTDPATLPALLDRHRPDRLVKLRRVQREAPLRAFGSWLYNGEARLLFGVRSDDVNGTPKIFSADFYRRLQIASTGDLFDLELMHHSQRAGLTIDEVAVPGFRRHGGRSTTTLGSAWNMYVGAVKLRWAIA